MPLWADRNKGGAAGNALNVFGHRCDLSLGPDGILMILHTFLGTSSIRLFPYFFVLDKTWALPACEYSYSRWRDSDVNWTFISL